MPLPYGLHGQLKFTHVSHALEMHNILCNDSYKSKTLKQISTENIYSIYHLFFTFIFRNRNTICHRLKLSHMQLKLYHRNSIGRMQSFLPVGYKNYRHWSKKYGFLLSNGINLSKLSSVSTVQALYFKIKANIVHLLRLLDLFAIEYR